MTWVLCMCVHTFSISPTLEPPFVCPLQGHCLRHSVDRHRDGLILLLILSPLRLSLLTCFVSLSLTHASSASFHEVLLKFCHFPSSLEFITLICQVTHPECWKAVVVLAPWTWPWPSWQYSLSVLSFLHWFDLWRAFVSLLSNKNSFV